MASVITIGTSSWSDPGFVEEWYPPGLAPRDRLAYYAERFDGVEVNSTHYVLPAAETVGRWARVTPPGFRFDVKLHRLLSRHRAPAGSLPADLREAVRMDARGRVRLDPGLEREMAARTLAALEPLTGSNRLSSLLLQLSPGFSPHEHELDELDGLLAALAPHPVAIELRHRSWAGPKRLESTLEWFTDHQVAWVAVDAPRGR